LGIDCREALEIGSLVRDGGVDILTGGRAENESLWK